MRLYDEDASAGNLSGVVGETLATPTVLLVFEGERDVAEAEAAATLRLLAEGGATALDPALCETWWDRRYDFYHPPHYPELPPMWGTIDAVASYRDITAVYEAVRDAVGTRFASEGLKLPTHFSHWYEWGSMVYPRFVVPDISGHPDPMALYEDIWKTGIEAILDDRRRDERPPRGRLDALAVRRAAMGSAYRRCCTSSARSTLKTS